MRKTTSETIAHVEKAIKACFAIHEADATLLEIPPEPRPGRSPGDVVADMMKAAATPRPEVAAEQWASAFRTDIQKHIGTLADLYFEGNDLMSVVQFLRGKNSMNATVPAEMRAAAVVVKESADATLPLATARRIELGIAPTLQELKRLRAYAEKSSTAAEVAIHKRLADFFEKCGPRYRTLRSKHEVEFTKAREKNWAIKIKPRPDRFDSEECDA